MNHLGSHAILNKKIDRGKDFIVKQDSQAWNNISQDFGHLHHAIGRKLKSFISRALSSTVPPLYDSISDSIKADECDKANLHNFFFTGQALVDGSQKNLPANNQRFTGTPLSSLSIMQAEVLDV